MAAKPNPLADRCRPLIVESDEDDLTEVAMFGGIGFMVRGNLAFAASSRGLLIRVGEAREGLLDRPEAEAAIMGKRGMANWIQVDADALNDDDAKLREWIDRGLDFARSLPPKP